LATTPIGSLNKLGCPVVDIEVSGPLPNSQQTFTALIDTGFSGFLSLPMLKAFPLGLVLHGTTNVVLADGNQQSKFTCLGQIEFCGQTEVGVIILEPHSDEPLVGMEFIRRFKRTLFVVPESGAVLLVSKDELRALVESQPTPASPAATDGAGPDTAAQDSPIGAATDDDPAEK